MMDRFGDLVVAGDDPPRSDFREKYDLPLPGTHEWILLGVRTAPFWRLDTASLKFSLLEF
jgi:hypothetical protein